MYTHKARLFEPHSFKPDPMTSAWRAPHSLPPLPSEGTIVDHFSILLSTALSYGPAERDMVVMSHEFHIRESNGDEHRLLSSFCLLGDSESSAMAKTVGLPVAIAAENIITGAIHGVAGVQRPLHRDIYRPILSGMSAAGINFTEEKQPAGGLEEALYAQVTRSTLS